MLVSSCSKEKDRERREAGASASRPAAVANTAAAAAQPRRQPCPLRRAGKLECGREVLHWLSPPSALLPRSRAETCAAISAARTAPFSPCQQQVGLLEPRTGDEEVGGRVTINRP